jgi:dipeptide/tripeptide permease
MLRDIMTKTKKEERRAMTMMIPFLVETVHNWFLFFQIRIVERRRLA